MSELPHLEHIARPATPLVPSFFEESPLTSSSQDTLARHLEALRLAKECQVAAEQSQSCVIGLVGEYGSGKSSVAAMAEEELQKDPRWLTVKFDPYMCLSSEGVVMDFFTTMAEAFERLPHDSLARSVGRLGISLLPGVGPRPREAWEGVKHAWEQRDISKKLGSLLISLVPFGSALTVGGVDVGKAAEVVGKKLATEPSIQSQKKELAKRLRGTGRNILVTIDDIDRLQPDQQALMFNLLRITGGLPKVYFLLLLHEPSIFQGLIASKAVENPEQAQAFMEKFIQFRHEMRPLGQETLERHVLNKFEALSQKYEHPSERMYVNRDRFTVMYREGMRHHLIRPRLINRFFAEVDADLSSMPGEVNVADYCGIHFLRRFEPEIYKLLQEKGNELLVQPERILDNAIPLWMPQSEHMQAKEAEITANRRKWEEIIKNALYQRKNSPRPVDSEQVASMLSVCTMLFPDALHEPRGYTPYGVGGMTVRMGPWKGVSTETFFNRYFNRGLGLAERAGMLAWEGIHEVGRGQRGPAAARLAEVLTAQPGFTITALDTFGSKLFRHSLLDPESADVPAVLAALDFTAEQYMRLSHTLDDDTFLQEDVANMYRVARNFIEQLPRDAFKDAIDIFNKHGAISLVGHMIALSSLSDDEPPPESWRKEFTDFFKLMYPQRLAHMLVRNQRLEQVPASELVAILFAANKLSKPGDLANMIWNQYLTPGRTSLETLLEKILILDPRPDFKSHYGLKLLPDPPSIRHEIQYKARLLSHDDIPSDTDILEANRLIIDAILGFEKTMATLPPIIARYGQGFSPTGSSRNTRLWDILDELQIQYSTPHMPPPPL